MPEAPKQTLNQLLQRNTTPSKRRSKLQQRLRSKSTDALHRQQSTSSSPNYRMDSGTLKKMLKPVRRNLKGGSFDSVMFGSGINYSSESNNVST